MGKKNKNKISFRVTSGFLKAYDITLEKQQALLDQRQYWIMKNLEANEAVQYLTERVMKRRYEKF